MSILPKLVPRSPEERRAAFERELIRQEAKIGAQLFGPLPKGHARQFFCLDRHTWIWHEEWRDKTGKHHVVTTRYEVRKNGVIKSQDGQASFQRLSDEEARNLYRAAQLYGERVGAEYRRILQPA